MLTNIHIQNYRLVDILEIELQPGLNILTGETGAGKSILIDAVDLALGARVDNQVVRPGSQQCHITLTFDLGKNPQAQAWLIEQSFENDEFCLIRRSISQEGKSRSTINGHPCTQNLVRQLAELILNIHGQHEQQTLLQRENQQSSLDEFSQHQHLLSQIKILHNNWQKINKELEQLKHLNQTQKTDFLRQQLEELEILQLQEGEWENLNSQHKELHQMQSSITYLNNALGCLAENENAILPQLHKILHELQAIKVTQPALDNAKNLLDTAIIHVQESVDSLAHYQNELNLNPQNLAKIETRISKLHEIARKYRVTPAELQQVQINIREQIENLDNLEINITKLEKQLEEILISYEQAAKKLSQGRQLKAEHLARLMNEKMQQLSMKQGEFKVDFLPTEKIIAEKGNESIQFLIRTNPGQPFLPLQKIVSGGELSRISLALQVILEEQKRTKQEKDNFELNHPTLIFDEVDTGIGGNTAEIVGQLLRKLGKTNQVLCITHLPQVAAQGHHHYKVEKIADEQKTVTTLKILNYQERIAELARMLSGSKITDHTLAHAEELFALAQVD